MKKFICNHAQFKIIIGKLKVWAFRKEKMKIYRLTCEYKKIYNILNDRKYIHSLEKIIQFA